MVKASTKSAVNVIMNVCGLNAFPQRSGTRQEYPFLPCIVNIVLDIPLRPVWQKIKI